MTDRELKIHIREYETLKELTSEDIELIYAARQACYGAYAKYSHFYVGAALRLANQQVITGNNQENAAYPSGLCAERVALFYANANHPDLAVTTLAVTAKQEHFLTHPTPPCGSCRQVLLETERRFGKPMRILLAGAERVIVFDSAADLLPLAFDDRHLDRTSDL
jgi:cytidine deaminase